MTGRLVLVACAVLCWRASGRGARWLPIWCALGLVGPWGLIAGAVLPPLERAAAGLLESLRRRVAQDEVRAAVPGLLTDLAMAAAAGQPLHVALRHACAWADGPIGPALAAFGEQVERGASVAAALEALRVSLGTPEVDRLVGLLGRDAQLGVPLRDSVARFRRVALGDVRKEVRHAASYLPYVFTALSGIVLLEGVALIAVPWLTGLWRTM